MDLRVVEEIYVTVVTELKASAEAGDVDIVKLWSETVRWVRCFCPVRS